MTISRILIFVLLGAFVLLTWVLTNSVLAPVLTIGFIVLIGTGAFILRQYVAIPLWTRVKLWFEGQTEAEQRKWALALIGLYRALAFGLGLLFAAVACLMFQIEGTMIVSLIVMSIGLFGIGVWADIWLPRLWEMVLEIIVLAIRKTMDRGDD